MKLRSDEEGWICSRMKKTMLHKNVEIRATWESMRMSEGDLERGIGAGCMMEER